MMRYRWWLNDDQTTKDVGGEDGGTQRDIAQDQELKSVACVCVYECVWKGKKVQVCACDCSG